MFSVFGKLFHLLIGLWPCAWRFVPFNCTQFFTSLPSAVLIFFLFRAFYSNSVQCTGCQPEQIVQQFCKKKIIWFTSFGTLCMNLFGKLPMAVNTKSITSIWTAQEKETETHREWKKITEYNFMCLWVSKESHSGIRAFFSFKHNEKEKTANKHLIGNERIQRKSVRIRIITKIIIYGKQLILVCS